MHKLASTPITLDCFELDDFEPDISYAVNIETPGVSVKGMAEDLIDCLEELRQKYNETGDKRYWKELIRWLPEGWLQTRTVTMSYANLRNIYFQRQHHKLTEWHEFCDWIQTLPYNKELITLGGNNETH
jgi:hypothetical protein